MPAKEGKIFIELVCPNCGSVMKNGWTFHPKEDEKTPWKPACPVCKQPITVEFVIN
jgi:hypothetical protein